MPSGGDFKQFVTFGNGEGDLQFIFRAQSGGTI